MCSPASSRKPQSREADSDDRHPGVLDRQGKVITGLTAAKSKDCTRWHHPRGMMPKLGSALDAVRMASVGPHPDGRVPNALLLEVLTSEGGDDDTLRRRPHFSDSLRYFAELRSE
jgi:acetylglutamate kinase